MDEFKPLVTITLQRYDQLLSLEKRTEDQRKADMLKLIDKLIAVDERGGKLGPALRVLRKAWSA